MRHARIGVLVSAFCGSIGFVGVAVPHLCRSLFSTSNHRLLIPATILMGGIVTLVADLLAQLPGSQITLPLNAVTALIGAPVVTWVILPSRLTPGCSPVGIWCRWGGIPTPTGLAN